VTTLREQIDQVLATLNPREQRVIQLRFGLEDGRIHPRQEVGREVNVTAERIRQIEARALRKLRHPTLSRQLQGLRAEETSPKGKLLRAIFGK